LGAEGPTGGKQAYTLSRPQAKKLIPVYILLRREGWTVNHKRGYRLYREEGLSMRVKRPRRHVSAAYREGRVPPGCMNDSWSMDFVSDSLV